MNFLYNPPNQPTETNSRSSEVAFLEIIVSFAFRRGKRPAKDDAVFGQTVYRDDFCMNGERGLFYAEKISLNSESTPALAHCLLKRRSALSRDSFSSL